MSHVKPENQGGLGQLVTARAEITRGLETLSEALRKVNGASGEDYAEIDRLTREVEAADASRYLLSDQLDRMHAHRDELDAEVTRLGEVVVALLPCVPGEFHWEHEGQAIVRLTRQQYEAAQSAAASIASSDHQHTPDERKAGERMSLPSVVRCTCRPPSDAHYFSTAPYMPLVLVVKFWPRDFRDDGAWRSTASSDHRASPDEPGEGEPR